jgi:hypothetical protein
MTFLSVPSHAERRDFLEWLEIDLSRVSGRILTEQNVDFLLEFFPYALEDTKRSDTVLRACKYACWLFYCIWTPMPAAWSRLHF